MEAGAIVGIVLASVALALIVGYLVYAYWWVPNRDKSKTKPEEFDETTRRRIMLKYNLPERDEDATVTMRGTHEVSEKTYSSSESETEHQ